jgi:hypothetical protein
LSVVAWTDMEPVRVEGCGVGLPYRVGWERSVCVQRGLGTQMVVEGDRQRVARVHNKGGALERADVRACNKRHAVGKGNCDGVNGQPDVEVVVLRHNPRGLAEEEEEWRVCQPRVQGQ